MSYGVLFYKNFSRDGKTVRLEVCDRELDNTTGKEIGNFQGLEIHINDENKAIDEAIHKSSCVFSMVNAPDMPDSGNTRYRGWEDLYTHDPTRYAVVVYEGGSVIWRGFITPDSWEDDLVYRGTVTITARDNIGRMQEMEFEASKLSVNANGMTTVWDIIRTAFSQASAGYVYSSGHNLVYNGQTMLNWAIDTRAFKDKTWYEAVEMVCVALGLTLRNDGHGRTVCAPLRDVHLLGNTSAGQTVHEPIIINRSGHRSIQSSYKQIKETVTYEAPDEEIDTFPGGQNADWTQGINQYTYDNPYGDETGGKVKYALVACPDKNYGTLIYSKRKINCANRSKVKVSYELAHRFTDTPASRYLPYKTDVRHIFEWQQNGMSLYWDFENCKWGTAQTYATTEGEGNTYSAEVNVEVITPDSKGRLVYWMAASAEIAETEEEYTDYPFIRLGNFTVGIDSSSFPAKLNVNTNYGEDYNLILTRNTDLGPCPSWMQSAGAIVNGIYLNDSANFYPPVKPCSWNDQAAALPIPVQVHMELIALHAKPNNIISGDIMVPGNSVALDARWELYGRKFMLTAGRYDVLTGYINSAVLTEYDNWSEVCGGMTADYTQNDDTYKAGTSSSTGMTVSGGGGGQGGGVTIAEVQAYLDANNYVHDLSSQQIATALGYTPANPSSIKYTEWNNAADKAHTHSNKGILDDIEQTDISSWNDASGKAHEHSNMQALGYVTTQRVGQWNSAYNDSHSHSNKTILDGIDQEDVNGWDDAAEKAHAHSNKAILDGITSQKVNEWNYSSGTSHTHSNKEALDSLTMSDVTNARTAYNRSHTHSNKEVLDAIDQDDISNWNAIADKALTKDAADRLYQPLSSGTETNISICYYGTTSYAAVEAAYRTKTVICDKSGTALPLVSIDSDDNFHFKGFLGDKITEAKLTSTGWSYTETEPGDSEFYVVNYGDVPEQYLDEIYNTGKRLICKKGDGLFFLTKMGAAGYYFGGTMGNTIVTIICGSRGWSYTETAIPKEQDAYYCEVAETTYSQAMAAFNAGKILFAHDGHTNVCMLADQGVVEGHDALIFCGFITDKSVTRYAICDDDEWRNY